MGAIYSNGPEKDFVHNPFTSLIQQSSTINAAAPYVTTTIDLANAARAGKQVRLIVGLNAATSPRAIRAILGMPNLAVRYFTSRFHAKIYVFDSATLLGSSNLTDAGMRINREATVLLQDEDPLNDTRKLFQELWESARILTPEILQKFEAAAGEPEQRMNFDKKIEEAVGKAEPLNTAVTSSVRTAEMLFLKELQQRVYEEFKPAFSEVTRVLNEEGLRRSEWVVADAGSETNRFLNWVRLVHAVGDDWRMTGAKSIEERRAWIVDLGKGWVTTASPRIADNYFEGLAEAHRIFGSKESIELASKDDITNGLMAIHAFFEQIRFTKGGTAALPPFFWAENRGHCSSEEDDFLSSIRLRRIRRAVAPRFVFPNSQIALFR